MSITLTKIALSFALVGGFLGIQISQTHNEQFLPENSLNIPVGIGIYENGMTQAKFDAILDRLQEVYGEIISDHGATLKINRRWDSGTVNASAQQLGSTWIINMYGGLARHDAVTADGFFLVACHEIGHHLGGAPKKGGWGGAWASNEGQSDYFATLKCLRKTFLDADNLEYVAENEIDPIVEQSCHSQFSTETEIARCSRVAMAGLSVASLFKALRNEPRKLDFSTPDPAVVSRTSHSHPGTQCRLDTYYQGAICDISDNQELDDNDYRLGSCTRTAGQTVGVRPRCWFSPN